MSRIFYATYIADVELSDKVDHIRFLCNPQEKQSAHLTLRGPYQKRLTQSKLEKFNDILKNCLIEVTGVGTFFNETQNTVFLKCNAALLKEVWKKKDFEFNPHISLYDGNDRGIASKLVEELQRFKIHFFFKPTLIHLMESSKDQLDFCSTWVLTKPQQQVQKVNVAIAFEPVVSAIKSLVQTSQNYSRRDKIA